MSYSVEEITLKSTNGINTLYGKIFIPDEEKSIKGIFQISHGMCEYIEKYDDFAKYLVERGYIVCGHSHIGHGRSILSKSELGFFAEENGYKYLIRDVYEITRIMKRRFPKIPYFLYGHSMGSFIVRCYLSKYGSELDGVLLSGTGGPNPLTEPALTFADVIIKRKGVRYRSRKLTELAVGMYNDKFKPLRNTSEWITSDIELSDKFSKDKQSDFTFTVGGYRDLFLLQKYCNIPKWAESVPNKLPIYIFCGDKDPVGEFGAGSTRVYNSLINSGCRDVTFRLYPNKRHDMINETNRLEVYDEIVEWLDSKTYRKRDIIKKINVIESLVNARSKDINRCEDDIFYNNDFVAVIDGISMETPGECRIIPR